MTDLDRYRRARPPAESYCESCGADLRQHHPHAYGCTFIEEQKSGRRSAPAPEKGQP